MGAGCVAHRDVLRSMSGATWRVRLDTTPRRRTPATQSRAKLGKNGSEPGCAILEGEEAGPSRKRE